MTKVTWWLALFAVGGAACGGEALSGEGDAGVDANFDAPSSRPIPSSNGGDGGEESHDGAALFDVATPMDASGPDCASAGGSCQPAGGLCLSGSIATQSCGDPSMWTCCANTVSTVDAEVPADSSTPPADAQNDVSWIGPPPAPGLNSCQVYNPATGGGCICEATDTSGHVYQAYCSNNSDPCKCSVDGKQSKEVPNLCEAFESFRMDCGFPL